MWSSNKDPFLTLGLSQSEPSLSEPSLSEPSLSEPSLSEPYITEWKPEPELVCPIPRLVVLKKGDWYLLVGSTAVTLVGALLIPWWDFAFFLVFTGLVLTVYLEHHRRLSKLLVTNGLATRGVVVEVEPKKYVDYEFGGYFYEADEYVVDYETPQRRYLKFLGEKGMLEWGNTLTVLYLPNAPKRAMAYRNCDYKAVLALEECR